MGQEPTSVDQLYLNAESLAKDFSLFPRKEPASVISGLLTEKQIGVELERLRNMEVDAYIAATVAPTEEPTTAHTTPLGSVAVGSFRELRDAVANAPTDGTHIVVEVQGDAVEWTDGDGVDYANNWEATIVVVDAGKNVLIRGGDVQIRTTIDAKASNSDGKRRRFFDVKEGATLELADLRLQNGYVASD